METLGDPKLNGKEELLICFMLARDNCLHLTLISWKTEFQIYAIGFYFLYG